MDALGDREFEARKTLQNLLFKEKYADLYFKWEDGTRIPAHKAIVFSQADYFE